MSRKLDGGSEGAEVPALPAPQRTGLRNKRTAVVVFAAGVFSGWLHRHDTICKDGKAPVAQRSDLLGNTEFRCHNGQTVTLSS